ncbi:patatin-like phospholipase family protein [Flavobacterium oreochromis]|uniref:Patatin n=2 Tax=Flavobacterium TaxID=237 RepID=A0A246G7E6_9FLAO|nr:patatin-like phospholipase family protein [Flavobacterium oreochromis]OWP74382.1 patatin [Flavobacterium oreochromis]OWP75996.1 patatin [Flavobacterium oreochromis]POR21599.1 patatin [Flavobacterium columnare]QYS86234.1 patatin-like phospholipase family protein [Flavobacterium oreochromis]
MNSRNIGIVLSGGGSKGLAHAGVLHFLDENGMKPKIISGTSAGAIIAALYAVGKSPIEILDFFRSIYFFHWRHFTFSKAGLIDGNAFETYFYKIFKDLKIGDLPIKIHITATDLVKGELRIFDEKTRIVDAVLASSSFPGVFSPYEFEGKLYSDGGILNHFPTDLLQGRCDYCIGVYVSPIQKIESKDLTSIRSVTARAFDLLFGNSSIHKFANCDWLIQPEELSKFGTFETSKLKMDEIFSIGYKEAQKTFSKQI